MLKLLGIALLFPGLALGQGFGPYSPAAGMPGSRAIAADSSIIARWTNNVSVGRGYQNYADPSLGKVSHGTEQHGSGASDGLVVSLGDSGYGEISFSSPLFDHEGPELAIFENSFSDNFMELAFVEVSSDGQHFVRFRAVCLTQDSLQIGSFGPSDPTQIYNLAGKFRAGYGTPFDLAELRDSAGVDITSVTHLRIVDVIGAINQSFSSHDAQGNPINDPWPTAFASGGFDLDAVAILHPSTVGLAEMNTQELSYFPNPAEDFLHIGSQVDAYYLYNCRAELLDYGTAGPVDVRNLSPGIYILRLTTAKGRWEKHKLRIR